MIGRLEGRLVEKAPEALLLDVGGVGYEVRVPLSTFLELPDAGTTVRLLVHTHVREDVIALYGFLRREDLRCFRLLLGVSGVGPRVALAILAGLPASELVRAVQKGDVAALRSVPGVGTKTAERILVDLRGRVEGLDAQAPRRAEDDVEAEAVSALLNLGYAPRHAERGVRLARERISGPPRLEELIREALRAATS